MAVNGVQIMVMFRDDATSSNLIDAVANRGGADRIIKHTQVGLWRGETTEATPWMFGVGPGREGQRSVTDSRVGRGGQQGKAK